jgi:peptide deformylase
VRGSFGHRRTGQELYQSIGRPPRLSGVATVHRIEPEGQIGALVNPVLDWTSEETETAAEGCLSIPGIWIDVARPVRVRMRALDERGERVEIDAEMPEARVLQHELDHLDGVLTLDRTSKEQRREALHELRTR